MREVMEYVKVAKNVEQAFSMIKEDTVEAIEEWLRSLDEDEAFELINNYLNCDLRRMSELDDDFSWMSPTRVLEELKDIDTSDSFYHLGDRVSGDDPWDVASEDIGDVAHSIYNDLSNDYGGYCEYQELNRILEKRDKLKEAVSRKYKQYEQAKIMFEKLMEDDPEATMTMLWNSMV